ncbi:MAG: restriction endonuclease, SacI family [Treponema sp.]|jgi:DNA (cytosine-5)-methyltransferase 1|nr:restriction endonuclease, SacI family [Treponema sp.]
MTPDEILEALYTDSECVSEQEPYYEIITENIDVLISYIDKNKSLISALVTSLLEKIINPAQNIRLHRTDFVGGYSARSLDTAVTVPFFKKYFPKYANKESAFLTLATRERIEWTKSDGQNLKIRNDAVKNSFLTILDEVEQKKVAPEYILRYLFKKLHLLSLQQHLVFDATIKSADFLDIITINTVLSMLETHFATKLSSRLPVIAVYTIYQQLFEQIKRYNGKILRPLNVHTASDKHGYGDIEIWNANDTPFEMVEIKHNISINRNLIFDVVKKSANTAIERYYILTTAKNNFTSIEEAEFIEQFIKKIEKDYGLEIIANGIQGSLKYYLRFINNYQQFLQAYTANLVTDAECSTEVQEMHITAWQQILQEHSLS